MRQAWRRARINALPRVGVADAAAALGIVDALDVAIEMLERRLPDHRRARILALLEQVMPYEGTEDGFAQWLIDNRGRFAYDQQAGKYVLISTGA